MPYDLADIKLREGYSEPYDPLLWMYLPPPLKEVFDEHFGSDAILIDKGVSVSDSHTGVDVPYRDWMPRIFDVLTHSDVPLAHKQVIVTEILQAREEIPTTPEKIKFVTDFATAIESFYDVWKGKWDEPIPTLYQSLRNLQVKLVTEKEKELKTKEP